MTRCSYREVPKSRGLLRTQPQNPNVTAISSRKWLYAVQVHSLTTTTVQTVTVSTIKNNDIGNLSAKSVLALCCHVRHFASGPLRDPIIVRFNGFMRSHFGDDRAREEMCYNRFRWCYGPYVVSTLAYNLYHASFRLFS